MQMLLHQGGTSFIGKRAVWGKNEAFCLIFAQKSGVFAKNALNCGLVGAYPYQKVMKGCPAPASGLVAPAGFELGPLALDDFGGQGQVLAVALDLGLALPA